VISLGFLTLAAFIQAYFVG